MHRCKFGVNYAGDIISSEYVSLHSVNLATEGRSFFFLSQILDGALCKAFKVLREFVSPLQVTHFVGSFTSPGIDTISKGSLAFSVSSERHRQMWGERNCLVSKRR